MTIIIISLCSYNKCSASTYFSFMFARFSLYCVLKNLQDVLKVVWQTPIYLNNNNNNYLSNNCKICHVASIIPKIECKESSLTDLHGAVYSCFLTKVNYCFWFKFFKLRFSWNDLFDGLLNIKTTFFTGCPVCVSFIRINQKLMLPELPNFVFHIFIIYKWHLIVLWK